MSGRVVHVKHEPYDVYIGRAVPRAGLRASKWANPFVIGRDGDRGDVIRQYREYVQSRPDLMAALPELRGKVLGCWCAPQSCHGDILAALANPTDCDSCDPGDCQCSVGRKDGE